MVAPTYTTDLVTVTDGSTGFTEPAGDIQGTLTAGETDFFIQGTNCTSKSIGNVTSPPKLAGAGYQAGAAITVPTDGAVLVWIFFACPNAISVESAGGLQCISGQDVNNYKRHYVRGSDTYTYGGWLCIPFDPANATDGTAYGTPNSTIQYLGWSASVTATISKGNPYGIDAIRYGRAEFCFTGGDSGSGYATFAGAVTQNDNVTNRWGLLQDVGGSYLQQGLILIGKSTRTTTNRVRTTNVVTLTTSAAHLLNVGDTVVITGVGGTGYNGTVVVLSVPSTTTFTYNNGTYSNEGSTADTGGSINAVCDFRDSNRTITIANTKKVPTAFNTIEVRNASTNIAWTGINITALGTISKGTFTVTDDATIAKTSCTFTDMNTFVYMSNSTLTNTIYRRCGQVTQASAIFDTCTFDQSTASIALVSNAVESVTDCIFNSDGTGHAVNIGNITSTQTLNWNNYLSGYVAGATGSPITPGTSSNEAILCNVSNGQTLTINVGSGYSIPSVKNDGTGTVNVTAGQVTTGITIKDLTSSVLLENARVLVWVTNNNNYFYQATPTSITGSGTTATVTQTSHGMKTGDYVIVEGVTNDDVYNGAFSITKTGTDTYTYTTNETIVQATASGTIKVTFAVISGNTNSSGYISDTRSWSSAQAITGWVRKSTYIASPPANTVSYYQQGSITGEITTGGGFSQTVQLVRDE